MRLKFLFANGSTFHAVKPNGDLLIWSNALQTRYPQSEAIGDPYGPTSTGPAGPYSIFENGPPSDRAHIATKSRWSVAEPHVIR